MKPFIRSYYNYDRLAASAAAAIDCSEDEDLTKQEFRDETDINTILKRFNITGQLPTGVRMPSYGDFTGISDFQEALAAIEQARDAFMEMPAHIRRRFDNDPGAFVDFFANPANEPEARRLGLVPAAELERGSQPASGAPATAPASASSPVGAPAVPAASAASSTPST